MTIRDLWWMEASAPKPFIQTWKRDQAMGQWPGVAEDRQKEPDTGKSSGWLWKRGSCLSGKPRRPSFPRLGERQWLKGDSTRIVTIRVLFGWRPARQSRSSRRGKEARRWGKGQEWQRIDKKSRTLERVVAGFGKEGAACQKSTAGRLFPA